MSGCNGLNSSSFPFYVVFVIFWWKQGSRSAKRQLRNLAEEDQDNFTPRRWTGYKTTLNFLADVTNGNRVKLSVVFIQRIYAFLKDIYKAYKTYKGKHDEFCCAGTEIRCVCLFFTVLIIGNASLAFPSSCRLVRQAVKCYLTNLLPQTSA